MRPFGQLRMSLVHIVSVNKHVLSWILTELSSNLVRDQPDQNHDNPIAVFQHWVESMKSTRTKSNSEQHSLDIDSYL